MGSYFAVNSSALVMSSLSLFPTVLHLMVLKMRMIFVITSSRFLHVGKTKQNQQFDVQISSRLGIIAMSTLSMINDDIETRSFEVREFGIFTADQMRYMMNTLINSLSIMMDKYSSMKIKYFHGFASTIVFSMIGTQL